MLVLPPLVIPYPMQLSSPAQFTFCFGLPFLQASPILIGDRQAVVEEKRSTNSRGKF